MSSRLVDLITDALTDMGGIAKADTVKQLVTARYDFPNNKNPYASISGTLSKHSSDCPSFKGERGDHNDLFFQVHRGVYGLRSHPFLGKE